jgi:proline iminopeptidase
MVSTEDGCQLWVEQSGQGQPLVLCHGGPGLWDTFTGLAVLLGGSARIVRWDQRGCGRSHRRGPYTIATSVADLDTVRQHAGGPRMALLGHSWGATLALRYALAHPDRVSTLIYVSGTGIDPDPTWNPVYKQNLRLRLGEHLSRWKELKSRTRTPAEDREMAVLQRSTDFADPDQALALAEQEATPWLGINYDCNAALNAETKHYLATTDVAAQCRSLDVPTLIIHGDHDIRPAWAVRSLHQALPHSQLLTLQNVGHVPWAEAADTFHATVADFLHRNEPDDNRAQTPSPAVAHQLGNRDAPRSF